MKQAQFAVELRALDALKPHPRNSKKHPPDQIAALSVSLEKFGWQGTIIASPEGFILKGHGTVEAAKWLRDHGRGPRDWADANVAPVRVAHGLDDAAQRAFIIADNRSAELGAWDFDMLGEELAALTGQGFDLTDFDFGALDQDFEEFQTRESEAARDTEDRKSDRGSGGLEREPAQALRDDDADDNASDLPPSTHPDRAETQAPGAISFTMYVVMSKPERDAWKRMKGEDTDKEYLTRLIRHGEAIDAFLSQLEDQAKEQSQS